MSQYSEEFQEMLGRIEEEDIEERNGLVSNLPYMMKKRKLSVHQVMSLEKYFVADNRLDPERKMKIAHELNLETRQVSVWFQNHRARYKAKHLEKEYQHLQASFHDLQDDYRSLEQQRKALLAQRRELKQKVEATSSGIVNSRTSTDIQYPNEALAEYNVNYLEQRVITIEPPHNQLVHSSVKKTQVCRQKELGNLYEEQSDINDKNLKFFASSSPHDFTERVDQYSYLLGLMDQNHILSKESSGKKDEELKQNQYPSVEIQDEQTAVICAEEGSCSFFSSVDQPPTLSWQFTNIN